MYEYSIYKSYDFINKNKIKKIADIYRNLYVKSIK